MKRGITVFLFVLIVCAGNLFGQSVWEGTASMGRYGEFPITGLYGASNSFPRNTLVEVEHIEKGKKTTVIIVNRIENEGFFMLLSREACGALDISQDDVANVRVQVAGQEGALFSMRQEDLPFNPDPDINPAAGIEDLNEFLFSEAVEPIDPDSLIPPEVEEPEETVLLEEPEEAAVVVEEPDLSVEEAVTILPEEEIVLEEEVEEAEPIDIQPRVVIDEGPIEEPVIQNILQEPDESIALTGPALEAPGDSSEEIVESFTPPIEEPIAAETPFVEDLLESPDETALFEVEMLDIPEEVAKLPVEEETPEDEVVVVNGMPPSPEEIDPLELAALNLPEEIQPDTLEETGETEETEETPTFIEEEIAAFVPIPENAELVLEPAEPRPPVDMVPEVINGSALTMLSDDIEEPSLSITTLDLPELILSPETEETIVLEPEEVYEDIPVIEDMPIAEKEVLIEEELADLEISMPDVLDAVEETAEEIVETAAAEEVFESGAIEPGAYYLQLGAFKEQTLAKTMASTLSSVYPVQVNETSLGTAQVYKVLLGPLTSDERGSMLITLRARGYKDAFIRRGE